MNAIKNLSLLFILSLFSFGCTSCSTIDPNADPIVVETERVLNTALDTFDVFLQFEFANHDKLLEMNADIAHYANIVRAQAPGWIAAANSAKNVYKAAKTPENKSALLESVAVLRNKLLESEAKLVSAKEGVAKP